MMPPIEQTPITTTSRTLSKRRIAIAIGIAIVADGLAIPFQAFPIAGPIIDIIAMILTMWLLGFHMLLLPTFALELVPLVDMIPTWTGCVLAVIAIRRKSEKRPLPPP